MGSQALVCTQSHNFAVSGMVPLPSTQTHYAWCWHTSSTETLSFYSLQGFNPLICQGWGEAVYQMPRSHSPPTPPGLVQHKSLLLSFPLAKD